MKYEFCGKLDCPDWILAQLFHASQMPLDKFEIICTSVKGSLLCGDRTAAASFDECKFFTQLGFYSDRGDESGGGDFDIDDARACFAAVNYIMANTCLHGVASKQLAIELEQLGLASEHSRVICTLLELADEDDRRTSFDRQVREMHGPVGEAHSRGVDGMHAG